MNCWPPAPRRSARKGYYGVDAGCRQQPYRIGSCARGAGANIDEVEITRGWTALIWPPSAVTATRWRCCWRSVPTVTLIDHQGRTARLGVGTTAGIGSPVLIGLDSDPGRGWPIASPILTAAAVSRPSSHAAAPPAGIRVITVEPMLNRPISSPVPKCRRSVSRYTQRVG